MINSSSYFLRRAWSPSLAAQRIPTGSRTLPTFSGARNLCPISGTVPPHALGRSVPQSLPRRRRRSGTVTRAVFEQFTERSIKAVMLSQHEAKALGSSEAGAVHILLGLLSLDPQALVIFLGPGATLEQGRKTLQRLTGRRRRDVTNSHDVAFTADAKRVFEAAQKDAKRQQQNFISPEHILIAVLNSGDAVLKQVLTSMKVDVYNSKVGIQNKLDADREAEGGKQRTAAGIIEGGSKKSDQKTLETYCRDLCEDARQGRLDPVIGREKEVKRVIQILARRAKNNPVLLGEPGTGKTAIAEGLAIAIVKGVDGCGERTPDFLRRKRILQLDVGALVSGSRERGELEKRITGILSDSASAGDVILMIDEIHAIVGAGAVGKTSGFASGGLDLGNLLKPALARGQLQVIGATTLKEHRQYFEKDAALERRFQPVFIGEPTNSEALDILRGLQDKYERFHKCIYTDGALAAAVALSTRYMTDRYLPDKAIDLLDEAGSRARISAYTARQGTNGSRSTEMDTGPDLELQQVLETKATCIQEGLWEEAQLLRERELELKKRLSEVSETTQNPLLPKVEPNDIATVVSAWTGIPSIQVTEDECYKLLNLGASLKQRVIGQDSAVDSIHRAIQRARSGLRDPSRPVATFLFSGPTGVGKTQLARALADTYFGSPSALIRLDMSEYMERHTVSRLLGSPPGFIGYGEGGTLTEAVRRQPHCLLLLDELEKAHPDIFNLLLQIFEDGRLTDSMGRTVSFKHALIVMTSNVGSNQIAKGNSQLGFSLDTDTDDDNSRLKSLVHDELKAYFRPELLNRMDDIIVFHQLGRSNLQTIADLLLVETSDRLHESIGVTLQLSRPLMTHLLDVGYDQAYGARPLKRAIIQLVEDPLADAILAGRLSAGSTAFLDLSADGKTVTVNAVDSGAETVIMKSEIVTKPTTVRKEAGAMKWNV